MTTTPTVWDSWDGRMAFRPAVGSTRLLIAMGDLDFHAQMRSILRERPPEYVFAGVRSLLARADLRLANLECVIVSQPDDEPSYRARLIAPLAAIDAIRAAGLDVLTFANNHVLDQGAGGLLECLARVRAAGIHVTGAGRNSSEARRPAELALGSLRLQVFAYSFRTGQTAGLRRAGCAEAKREHILADLRNYPNPDAIRVVCLHMDAEFEPSPSPTRVALCRELAERGVKIVLCHHPHVIQGMERWNDSLIVYSLGNYVTPISDYMLARSRECHLSYHVEIELDADGVTYAQAVPVVLGEHGCPREATGSERAQILKVVADRSSVLQDPAAVLVQYQKMVTAWASSSAKHLYWSLGECDFRGWKMFWREFAQTPMKRRWFRDAVVAWLLARREPQG